MSKLSTTETCYDRKGTPRYGLLVPVRSTLGRRIPRDTRLNLSIWMDESRYCLSHTRQATVHRLRKLHGNNIVSSITMPCSVESVIMSGEDTGILRLGPGRYLTAGHEHLICHLHHSCYDIIQSNGNPPRPLTFTFTHSFPLSISAMLDNRFGKTVCLR